MGHIGTDLALALVHPLLDLGQVLIDQLRSRGGLVAQPPRITGGDVPRHSVVGDPGELAGVPVGPCQVERFENFHDLLGRLHVSLLGAMGASAPLSLPGRGPEPPQAARQRMSCRADPMTASGQLSCPPPGNYLAVSGQSPVAADTDCAMAPGLTRPLSSAGCDRCGRW